jgi:CheY-like chemotaxis protein
VYGIATRLGGHVEIASKPDLGTKVTLLLPTVDSESTATRSERAPSAFEAQGEVVLVVDDDETLRRSTARMLSSHGYAVLEASDGVDGLAKYRDADPPPAVVVTDVVMPGMTGPELAEAVAAADPRSRVVFMSGYPEGLDEAHEDAPLVAKPFTAEVLLTAVSEALATPEASIR